MTKEELLQRKALLERKAELTSKASQDAQPTSDQPKELSIGERARFGVGNVEGILDYLRKQGRDAEFRNGDLYLGKGEDAVRADPSNLMTYLKNAIPGLASEEEKVAAAKDFFKDVAELPSDVVSMIASGLGGAGGAAAGAIGGPVGAGAGMIAGSGVGSFGAEKLKEAIGKRLGVYKTGGEFFTPEAEIQGAIGAGAAAIPAVVQGAKTGGGYIAKKLKGWKVPQRIFASGANLSDEMASNPDAIETLIKDGVKGSKHKLASIAEAEKEVIGAAKNELLAGKETTWDEVVAGMKDFTTRENIASGDRKSAEKALDKVLAELKQLFKGGGEEVGTGVKRTAKIADAVLEKEKTNLAKAGARAYGNPDAKISIPAKAKKFVADNIRPVTAGKNEGLAELNKRYHAYDALGDAAQKLIDKNSKLGLTDIAIGGGGLAAGGPVGATTALAAKKALESSALQTNAGSWLYKMLNKVGPQEFKTMPKTQGFLQALMRQIDKSDSSRDGAN